MPHSAAATPAEALTRSQTAIAEAQGLAAPKDVKVSGASLPAIEPVTTASFPPPTADDLGDHESARLLRSALQIGFRSSAGPFRSLAGISVEPRAYQLVPLLMALRQDTVRLLLADDASTQIVVASAMRGTTNALFELGERAAAGGAWKDALDVLELGIGAPLSADSLQRAIGYDLAVSGVTPKLFLPSLSWLTQGPGFPNLSCLGLLSDRVLGAEYATPSVRRSDEQQSVR